jgi:hypothetical protein
LTLATKGALKGPDFSKDKPTSDQTCADKKSLDMKKCAAVEFVNHSGRTLTRNFTRNVFGKFINRWLRVIGRVDSKYI